MKARRRLPGWMEHIRNAMSRLIAQKWLDIGLRAKMSALVTIGLTGLLGIFSYIGIASIHQANQQLLDEHMLRARILATNLDSNLGQTAGLLTMLATHIDMENPSADLRDWSAVFAEDFGAARGVYLLGQNADLIAAAGPLAGVDWQQVPGIGSTSGLQDRVVSVEGIPSPYAVVAVPVMDGHSARRIGTLAAVLDLSDPDIFLSGTSPDLERVGTLQLLDGAGRILASSQEGRSLSAETIQDITATMFVQGQPKVEACLGCTADALDDTGVVIAFVPLTQAPWGVVLWHQSQSVVAPARTLARQAVLLAGLAMAGALVLVLVTTRSVIVPVQALTEATRRIGENHADTAALQSVEQKLTTTLAERPARRDEIGVLANSFVMMCRRLRDSLEEIGLLNRELDNRVQARTQQLSTLNAVALTVNQSLNLEDILNRALDEVCQLTGIDVAAIFLRDASSGALQLMASRGLSQRAAVVAHQVGMLDGACGGVMDTGIALVVPDLSQERGRAADSLRREQVTALMHVPLITKGWALGSMCVGTRNSLQFDEQEQKLLNAIGNQIAIAVENARLYAEVQHKERLRGGLFRKALAAQEDERKRIARELHDEVSQSLTALLYKAEGGLELESPAATSQRLESICDLTQRTLDNIHQLILDLRPSVLDQLGLIPALRWLAETWLQPRGMRVRVEATADGRPMEAAPEQRPSPELETALYRVVQEAVHNIARHSDARNVEIKLELREGTASMVITDDGIGFDLTQLNMEAVQATTTPEARSTENMRGLGIMGMQERIELLGGEMDLRTSPGGGTRIEFRVPIRERRFA